MVYKNNTCINIGRINSSRNAIGEKDVFQTLMQHDVNTVRFMRIVIMLTKKS